MILPNQNNPTTPLSNPPSKTQKIGFVLLAFAMALVEILTLRLWTMHTCHGQYWLGRFLRLAHEYYHQDTLGQKKVVWRILTCDADPLIRAHAHGLCRRPRQVA